MVENRPLISVTPFFDKMVEVDFEFSAPFGEHTSPFRGWAPPSPPGVIFLWLSSIFFFHSEQPTVQWSLVQADTQVTCRWTDAPNTRKRKNTESRNNNTLRDNKLDYDRLIMMSSYLCKGLQFLSVIALATSYLPCLPRHVCQHVAINDLSEQ